MNTLQQEVGRHERQLVGIVHHGGVVAYPFQGTLVFQLDAIGEVVD